MEHTASSKSPSVYFTQNIHTNNNTPQQYKARCMRVSVCASPKAMSIVPRVCVCECVLRSASPEGMSTP